MCCNRHGLDDDASPLSAVAEKLYVPEQTLERETQILYKKRKGKYGAIHKKAVNFQERILIQWVGHSVAEATWENDVDYFNTWCPAVIKARDLSEVPDSLI